MEQYNFAERIFCPVCTPLRQENLRAAYCRTGSCAAIHLVVAKTAFC